MAGLSSIALGAAPVFGAALLLTAGGQLLGGFDFRSGIKDDLELLRALPEEESARRAALRQSIIDRVDDLIETTARRRQLRNSALTHQGTVRDIVMLVNSVVFTIVWWYVDHDRLVWLPLFVVLIAATAISALFAWSSVRAGFRRLRRTPGATR